MRDWKPVDWIALVFTISICMGFIISLLGPLILGVPISDLKAKIVGNLFTTMVSIVSMFIGAKLGNSRDK